MGNNTGWLSLSVRKESECVILKDKNGEIIAKIITKNHSSGNQKLAKIIINAPSDIDISRLKIDPNNR